MHIKWHGEPQGGDGVQQNRCTVRRGVPCRGAACHSQRSLSWRGGAGRGAPRLSICATSDTIIMRLSPHRSLPPLPYSHTDARRPKQNAGPTLVGSWESRSSSWLMMASAVKSLTCGQRARSSRVGAYVRRGRGAPAQAPCQHAGGSGKRAAPPGRRRRPPTSPPRKMMRCRSSRPKGSPAMSCVLRQRAAAAPRGGGSVARLGGRGTRAVGPRPSALALHSLGGSTGPRLSRTQAHLGAMSGCWLATTLNLLLLRAASLRGAATRGALPRTKMREARRPARLLLPAAHSITAAVIMQGCDLGCALPPISAQRAWVAPGLAIGTRDTHQSLARAGGPSAPKICAERRLSATTCSPLPHPDSLPHTPGSRKPRGKLTGSGRAHPARLWPWKPLPPPVGASG